MLQRAVLVNSVLCREAMLLGRIMEEEEAVREKKQGRVGRERQAIYVIISLFPVLLNLL